MPASSSCHNYNYSWTLTFLIRSYTDLALLLLIGSTLLFFTSKWLSLFGLSLPCPCAQTLILDSIRIRIESLHSSIRTRNPFDAGSEPDKAPPQQLRLVEDDGDERVAPVIMRRRRIRRQRAKGPLRLRWGEVGLPDNFGSSESKDETFMALGSGDGQTVEDSVSMVGEAAPATDFCSAENTLSFFKDAHESNENTELTIQNLERELEEAQAAHSALYLELEKERSAAASAADEAMAMILRLQSEKAALEMESRQYQRMIEEKSAYDEEEMEILKEIIVMREREKHVLEKEVEKYREVVGGKPDSLFGSRDDSTFLLTTLCESIRKKEKDECNIEFQEKDMVMVDIYPSESTIGVLKDPSFLGVEEDERRDKIIERTKPDEDQRGNDSSQLDSESSVLDVHVIDDAQNSGIEENKKDSNFLDESSTSNVDLLAKAQRSSSDSDLTRNLMSAVDGERFNLETEVEILRKRLKTIQQGRENLSLSLEYRENESFQLQLLEDIACQLQEIRKITEPGKSIRQSSLPPLSSKAPSKKKRCRGVSSGLNERVLTRKMQLVVQLSSFRGEQL